MFLVYNLNIITYRHDSFLFNYHATIINQQFNHHFSRFTREIALECKVNLRYFDAGFSFIVQEPKEIMDWANETSFRPRRVI